MKNTLTISLTRKGSGFLLSFSHDDRDPTKCDWAAGLGPVEDIATDLKNARHKIDKFLDDFLEPKKGKT